MTAERDLRAQLRLLCAELRRASPCSAAAVILLDPDQGTVEAIESNGLPLAADAQWQQAVRAAPGGTEADVVAGHLTRGCAVPLLVGDERLGVVLTFHSDSADTTTEVAYVTALAEAAALAILNTRLYAQSHRELRRRDALREVVASISSELDLDSLLGRVVA